MIHYSIPPKGNQMNKDTNKDTNEENIDVAAILESMLRSSQRLLEKVNNCIHSERISETQVLVTIKK